MMLHCKAKPSNLFDAIEQVCIERMSGKKECRCYNKSTIELYYVWCRNGSTNQPNFFVRKRNGLALLLLQIFERFFLL